MILFLTALRGGFFCLKNCYNGLMKMQQKISPRHIAYSKRAYVLEINYNPQLVTVESFKDRRITEFLKAMEKM